MQKKINSNKRKIINDPVYGFINVPSDEIFMLIEHPVFQRLRRIKQLGLTYYIYPGATHNRFQHSLGAMYLMVQTIDILRSKNIDISNNESQGLSLAILLHDIGHGPFSHSLELNLIQGISHEDISLQLMNQLNTQFTGLLDEGIRIFSKQSKKKFLQKLVSSQLDMDRLDYLRRDSFYTGVSEGVIGSDRIIKMLHVVDDDLVVEAKGIYSIEKFLIARRLMYWQVYFHKTVVAAEQLLQKILERAKYLSSKGEKLFASPAFSFFLQNKITKHELMTGNNFSVSEILEAYCQTDDYDIFGAIKVWSNHPDKILAILCKRLINRSLPRLILDNAPFDANRIEELKKNAVAYYDVPMEDIDYIVFTDQISNNAYSIENDNINIIDKNGELRDIAYASDISNVSSLSKTVKKFFLCYPKECETG